MNDINQDNSKDINAINNKNNELNHPVFHKTKGEILLKSTVFAFFFVIVMLAISFVAVSFFRKI